MFFGGERSALLYGLIGTCLLNDIDPERWGKHLRNWDYISEVYLNPEKEAA